jgi:O-antigen/teichoic acid export membrane protein
VLVILPAFTILSFEYSIVGLVTATFLRFLWLIVLLIKNKTFIFSLEKQILLLKNSLPLILSSFIAGSIPYIDGIIVSNYYDNNTFAIFRYGSRELPISVLLANTFSNAMLPVISKSPETLIVLNDLKNKSLQLIHILFPISIVLIVVSKYLFEFMFNPMFVQSSSIFNVMLLLVIPRLVFPQAILIAKKYQKYTLLASIIEWMSKLILSFILMKIFNIFGIALATFFAFTIEKVVLAFFVFIKLKIKPNIYIPIKWLTFYSALIIITFMFVEYPNLF